jgi:hypothetical protein
MVPTKKSSKVSEEFTFAYNDSLTTQISVGSNAFVGNSIYQLYNKNSKNVGYILFNSFYRTIPGSGNFSSYQCGLFLNNNADLLSISYCQVSSEPCLPNGNSETTAKSQYNTGKYTGKNVTVTIKTNSDSTKGTVVISYNN